MCASFAPHQQLAAIGSVTTERQRDVTQVSKLREFAPECHFHGLFTGEGRKKGFADTAQGCAFHPSG
jgi:hypothetical protein